MVRRALLRGVDVETLHVDVCSTLSLFGSQPPMPGAERAAHAIQLPVYASLRRERARRVAARIRRILERIGTLRAAGRSEAVRPVPHER